VLFVVFKLPQGNERVEKYEMPNQGVNIGQTLKKSHREISLRVTVGPGKYVIVPATELPQQKGEFAISIYFKARLRDVDFSRIDKPENCFEGIEEEIENNLDEEEWKVNLCQERIKTMIFEEDNY
jgi:hypothetical protein